MQEKELRLAIVLTGGVSLAVYMHGVTRELLKLVRASKVYHSISDTASRQNATYQEHNDDPTRESDTEEIYFELIQSLAKKTELRIVIDVISGASAGGVNGVMLARALAHDLPLDSHRAMWLEHADVLELMDDKTRANRWSKFYLEPFFRGPFYKYFAALAPEEETREKLFTFLKSRWFSPPFSGRRFSKWMLEAAQKMEEGRDNTGTLLPDGHELDLYVNITDFQGHNRTVELHDPQTTVETEHRLRLHFGFVKQADDKKISDFDHDMLPSLVFAARATSSFPGAFPAMTFKEMDEVLNERRQNWEGRQRFIDKNFSPLILGNRDPEKAYFIDGSTVNNKPFAVALSALASRPAHRQVSRRLLYVDPEPDAGEQTKQREMMPNMFRTILGALLEIPRNEPVRDELERLNDTNRRMRMLHDVIELSRPHINKLVEGIIAKSYEEAPTIEQIADWRRTVHVTASEGPGLAYESYFRIRLFRVLSRIENLIIAFAEKAGEEKVKYIIRQKFREWTEKNILAIRAGNEIRKEKDVDFLKSFDVDFCIRRVRFVIQRLNQLYKEKVDTQDENKFSDLDEIKTTLYHKLSCIKQFWSPDFYPENVHSSAQEICSPDTGIEAIETFLNELKIFIDLDNFDVSVDEVFSVMALNYMGPNARKELFTAYIGFGFFDVLSLPLVQDEDLIELDEILIHRISPKDAEHLRVKNNEEIDLKGRSLRSFGGFFNRSFREHDYLVGRLTAADRVVDVVLDTENSEHIDRKKIKKRLYQSILNSEIPFLKHDPDLIKRFQDELL